MRKGVTFINFVRKDESATGKTYAGGILLSVSDWQMQADKQGRATFPHEIAVIAQRSDTVLWSTSTR